MKSSLRLTAVAALALTLTPLWAQSLASRTIVVHGEIVSNSPIPSGLTVELVANGVGVSETATVDPDNTFEFRSATPGAHELRVIAPNGQVIQQEYVSVGAATPKLSVHLADQNSANRSAGSTISLQQLGHKVPPAAQKAFQKGEQAESRGNLPQARGYFEQAVNLDPEFADAYNELGAAEAKMNELPKAAEEFQKAIDLAPEHRQALPNLSIVLAKMKRFREAADVARRALRVVPGAGRIHYILAASLLAEHGNINEIILHFDRATGDMPSAHFICADLLAQEGRQQEAIRHLEDFLASASQDDSLRAKAEARLAELRR